MPTLNVDKIAALNKSVDVQLNKLAGVDVITGNSRKVSDVANSSGNNKNYYSSHPPEVFFVQEIGKETIYPFMLNFVPTDPNKEFGQNNKWTGTLYEWNLTGDTLVVQELKESKIAKRYGIKMQKQGISQQAKIFENGNALNGLSDKKISGAWADFWQGVGEAIAKVWGGIGEFFGVASDDPFDGHDHAHWNTIDWNAIGNFFTNLVGDGAGTSGSGSFGNTGSGYGLYSSYTPGIQNPSGYNDANGSNPIGGGSNNSAQNWVDVPGNTTYPTGGHNNNQPVYSLELNTLLQQITLSPYEIDFLQDKTTLIDKLNNFLDDNGFTIDSKNFTQWTVGYMYENRYKLNIPQFLVDFFPTTEIISDPDVANWTDPDDEVLVEPDQTVYQQYQDNQSWPTIKQVIKVEDFVPNRHILGSNIETVNCLILAKEQLAKKGYTVSGFYIGSSQIFQSYTEAGGVDFAKTRLAVSYIIQKLSDGIPVLAGVDVIAGAPPANKDNSTDHFIVIVGMGTDAKGKYFQFMDSSTNWPSLGASESNRLYFNSVTGKISGKTMSQYGARSNRHDFIVTQIRKSIKK